MATKAVSDDSFEADVLKADGLVLVDFWAEWCGPCKQIGPALEEIAKEQSGKITVAKVNIDQNPMAPSKYGVRGIPTLLIFKDGEEIGRQVGAMAKSKIEQWIEGAI
jgi:thioredoxin 1